MKWTDRLASLPVLRTRWALRQAVATLHRNRAEIRSLRERIAHADRRLQRERRRRRSLEQRLAAERNATQPPFPSADRPLLVFDHIPKTAGTTFRRSYLPCALPRHERFVLSGGQHNARDRERLLSMTPDALGRLRIVAGHDTDVLRTRLPGARFVSLIRDPVHRAVSSYLHALLHDSEENLWADVREQKQSLRRFVSQYVPANAQSLTILGQDYASLDAAGMQARLNARYALVGCTEQFAEFVFMLHAMEGVPLCLFNNRLVRHERAQYAASDEDLAFVRERNAVDARLHHIVREEFAGRTARLPHALQARLRRYLDALDRFRAETGGDVRQAVRLDDSAREGPFEAYWHAVFGDQHAEESVHGSTPVMVATRRP